MIGPQILPANQPSGRFYRGGARIAEFRRSGPVPANTPEDWVGSTTRLFGEDSLGLSRLPNGELLADAIHRDPVAWLGPRHVQSLGEDTALLVKLLDAGQRLPVHVHPDVRFANEHLALGHGMTEGWVFLEPGVVHVGFNRDVGVDELAGWVRDQNVEAMLTAMHSLRMQRGDAMFVPAGLPHAIGEGCFLVELQEPTDLSVLVEWEGFGIDGLRDGHLGLGHATALQAVNREGREQADIERLRSARAGDTGDLLPAATPFFRAERTRGEATWEPGYAVAIVTAGSGYLAPDRGDRLPVRAGDTVVVPFAAGWCRLKGGPEFDVIRCRSPQP